MNDAFIFLLSILISLIKVTYSNTCVHYPPRSDQIEFVNLKSKGAISKRNAFNNLRIKVFYEPTVNFLPKHKLDIIQKNIIPSAANFWHQALLVRPLISPLRLKRRCPYGLYDQNACHITCANVTTCGEVVIPDDHLMPCEYCIKNCSMIKTKSKGIEGADFVFYISTQQTERCSRGSTVAYAAHCQQETSMDRPIAGHVNLCPDSISTKSQDIHSLLSTVKHEMLHALGFSIALYGYFRTPLGKPLTSFTSRSIWELNKINVSAWTNLIKVVTRSWYVGHSKVSKTVHVIATPNVLAEVRKHFNCSSLEGAELEDQGGDGTRLTHWEKRLFENEAMTGTHTQNPIFSRLTFAMMEDTGWYRVNYTLAEPLQWGRNLGCDFAMKSCREWIIDKRKKGHSIHPYCDKLKEAKNPSDCMDDRNALALCNLKRYKTPLPLIYQNFDTLDNVSKNEVAYYGGSVKLADYCPYKQEFTWKSLNPRGSKCKYPENSPPDELNFALEYYGEQSKCFEHTKIWKTRNCFQIHYWEHWGSGCYKYSCDKGRLRLIIANRTFTCFYTKQEITIQITINNLLHTGGILCPSCREICNGGEKCFDKVLVDQPNISHTKDVLQCSSFHLFSDLNVAIFVFILYIFISLFMCKLRT